MTQGNLLERVTKLLPGVGQLLRDARLVLNVYHATTHATLIEQIASAARKIEELLAGAADVSTEYAALQAEPEPEWRRWAIDVLQCLRHLHREMSAPGVEHKWLGEHMVCDGHPEWLASLIGRGEQLVAPPPAAEPPRNPACTPTDPDCTGNCEACPHLPNSGTQQPSAGHPTTHHLKAWPEPFQAVASGIKRFEFRRNDRYFCVGDTLALEEWEPTSEQHTGAAIQVLVSYVLYGPAFGIPEGYCIMSIAPCEPEPSAATESADDFDESDGEPRPDLPDGDCTCRFPLPRDASQGDLRCARCDRMTAKPAMTSLNATTTTGNVHFVQVAPCPHCGETGICFCGRCQRCGRFRESVEGGREGGGRGAVAPESHTESASSVVPNLVATSDGKGHRLNSYGSFVCEDHKERLEELQHQRERNEERLTHLENAVGEERREVRDRLAALERITGTGFGDQAPNLSDMIDGAARDIVDLKECIAVLEKRLKGDGGAAAVAIRCVKCNNTDIHTRWMAPIRPEERWRHNKCGNDAEHLHRYCRRCSYEWCDETAEQERARRAGEG